MALGCPQYGNMGELWFVDGLLCRCVYAAAFAERIASAVETGTTS